MRKIKVLSLLLALLICASMLLTACNSSEEATTLKLADVMNKDWKAEASNSGVITSFSEFKYEGSVSKSDKCFVVTTESNPKDVEFPENSDDKSMLRVYNVDTNKQVLSIKNYSYDIVK